MVILDSVWDAFMQLLKKPVNESVLANNKVVGILGNLCNTPTTDIVHTPSGHARGSAGVFVLKLLNALN